MKNKTKLIIFFAIFEIFLLVNLTTAESYTISRANSIQTTKVIDSKKIKNFINSGLNLLIGFLSIKQIGSLSAQETPTAGCCPKTKSGAICQDVLSTFTNCSVPLLPTNCDRTTICNYGCCFDEREGMCSSNSPKQTCQQTGGTWSDDESCLIEGCQKGCCVLRNYVKFTTDRNCERESLLLGIQKDFRDIEIELECLALVANAGEGACVHDGYCRLETRTECADNSGRFVAGAFCSNPELETSYRYDYQPHHHKGCIDGKEDIYWFDSEGNREEIAQNCGNNFCDAGGGTATCKSRDCVDTYFRNKSFNGRNPKNGESWCVYEGYIGDGKDTVGSEHYKAYCLNGKINEGKPNQLCAPYRSQICTEIKMEVNQTNFFVRGECVLNEATLCMGYNPLQEPNDDEKLEDIPENIEKCQKNTHCMIKEVDVTGNRKDNFKFKTCVPKYPKGADVQDPTDENVCELGNMDCVVVYQKEIDGQWSCIQNCDCEKDKFAQQMNDLCISLGDCGSYINYIGKGTNNIQITGKKGKELDGDGKEKDKDSQCLGLRKDNGIGRDDCARRPIPTHPWERYTSFVRAVLSQKVEPQSLDRIISLLGGNLPDPNNPGVSNFPKQAYKLIGTVSGYAGLIATPAALGYGLITTSIFESWSFSALMGSSFLGTIGIAATGAVLGSTVSYYLGKWTGVSGTPLLLMAITGGIAGAILLLNLIGLANSWNPVGWVMVIITAIIEIFSLITGWGDAETRYVEFKCLPWTPPAGGEDCEKCDDNPMIPCTKYKCESLGLLCEIVNEDTQNPSCVPTEREANPPVISPKKVLTPGYKFTTIGNSNASVKIEKISGGCISQGNVMKFVLETDELSQCKWSTEQPINPNYDNFEGVYTEEETIWHTNHTISYLTLRVNELDSSEITGSVPNRIGHPRIYVKCQDRQNPSNFNFNDYVVEVCVSERDTEYVDFGLTVFDPKKDSILAYGKNEINLTMWINEPAECRYSPNPNQNYENMNNSFDCDTTQSGRKLFGWPCKTTLTGLTRENKVYIRCKDQPYNLSEGQTRNVNNQDFPYTIYVSESDLSIDQIYLEYDDKYEDNKRINDGGTIISSIWPIAVDLIITTSGGAENGLVQSCEYKSTSGWNDYFYPSDSTTHSYTFEFLSPGAHSLSVSCEDKAGNIANANISFYFNVDTEPPIVVRAYQKDNRLNIITNELAECFYDTHKCNFNLENATDMTTGLLTIHTAEWVAGQTYYIKCKDAWENTNPSCAIIVSPIF